MLSLSLSLNKIIHFKDPNNPNQNNQSSSGDSGGDGGNQNNKPKCSKCPNDALYSEVSITIKETGQKKTIYSQPVCEPCSEELLKCQECKNKQAEHISTKNNSEIILCSECYQKIQEQENSRCKECSLIPNLPYFKCNTNDQSIYCLHPSNCWAKVEESFRKGEYANKHLSFVRNQEDLKNVAEAMVKWDEEKNAWIFLKNNEIAWQPSQKEKPKNYIRKYSAIKANCCNGKCQKNLADEPILENTMTCNRCQNKFSQGYAVHSPNIFFCEKCGQENHADGEFKVWVEVAENQQNQNNQEPKPNPPAEPKPNPQSKPRQEAGAFECSKCKKKTDSCVDSRSYTNGILVWGFCNACNKAAQQDTTCYKCRQNQRIGKPGIKDWNFCSNCLQEQANNKRHCPECQKIIVWSNWEDQQWKDRESRDGGREEFCSWVCMSKASRRDPNNPHNKRQADDFLKEPLPLAKPSDLCERCGIDCRTDIKVADKGDKFSKTWKTIRKRITHYYTDFTSRVWFFGMNCPCAEQFKRENQQTCRQCQKREWPDMKKGWLLDYELKKAFCSPTCHISYRENLWEEENQVKPNPAPKPNPSEWTKNAELFPTELELSDGGKKEDFDWEKEGSKKEILHLRETVKELKRQLENSEKKPTSQQHTNEISHQERQVDYLLKLHQNTQKKVEKAFESKYGKAELSALDGSSQGQPKKNYWPLIIGVSLFAVGLIGGLIFSFWKRKK